jgi:hypothetical protein
MLGFAKTLQVRPPTHRVRKSLVPKAEPCSQLDPQSLVVQCIGVLIGGPSFIAGTLNWSFAVKPYAHTVKSTT